MRDRDGWTAYAERNGFVRSLRHGLLVLEPDALYLHCPHCGFISPGVIVDSRRVRRAWAFDRMRLRFRRAS
jgi:hypothetical protein